ncbi:hypothetical protein [Actinoplanes sp. NPDC026619]|uniref:hypothetical protein n=1 Tax=Actinoplanes sp. NPDC026619 TaxID=3155798 RepID=UPI0033F01E3B
MPAEVLGGTLVANVVFGVGMPGGDLHVAEADARVEHGYDGACWMLASHPDSGYTGTGPPIQPCIGATPITWDNGINKILKVGQSPEASAG